MLRDTVVEEESEDTRTHKIFRALEEICYEFDLGKPIWLDFYHPGIQTQEQSSFYQDSFIEEVPFRLSGDTDTGGIKRQKPGTFGKRRRFRFFLMILYIGIK